MHGQQNKILVNSSQDLDIVRMVAYFVRLISDLEINAGRKCMNRTRWNALKVPTLLCGECGKRTCVSHTSYVLTRHVYLCTQHTDVHLVWCGHWTARQRRNVDQVDVTRYNLPNGIEYADAESRAMKNRVVTSIILTAYASIRSMLKSKYCSLMQFSLKVLGHLLIWIFDVWTENQMTCIDNVRASYL